MALSNYAQLCESVKAELWERDDLSARIPDWIALTEADANHRLRVRQMEAQASITLTDGAGNLPADYLAYIAVYGTGACPGRLEATDANWALQKYPGTDSTNPRYFYILGSTIRTAPVSNVDLTMLYWQVIPPLATASTNWLLAISPGIYLYGALVHAAPYLDDGQRLQEFTMLRDQAVALLEQSNITGKYAKVQSRLLRVTP